MTQAALAQARAENRLPVFVGGTGLYFKALLRGLANVPPVPEDIRASVRARLERDGVEALHAELLRRDPLMGETLKPRDQTRVAVARSVRGDRTLAAALACARSAALLSPDRVTAIFLFRRIVASFTRGSTPASETMMASGALEEVAVLAARKLDPMLPADEGAWRAGSDPAYQRRAAAH